MSEQEDSKVLEFVFLWQNYNFYYRCKFPKLNDKNATIELAKNSEVVEFYEIIKVKFINDFMKLPSNHQNNKLRKYVCK